MKIPFLCGPVLVLLALATNVNAADEVRWFSTVQSIVVQPTEQIVVVTWTMSSMESDDEREFQTVLDCGHATAPSTFGIPDEGYINERDLVDGQNGVALVISSKWISTNGLSFSLTSPSLAFFCDKGIVKIDFKELNTQLPVGSSGSAMWNGMHPPFDAGRFNFDFNMSVIYNDDRGKKSCGYKLSTIAFTKKGRLQKVNSVSGYTQNCIAAFYYSQKNNTLVEFIKVDTISKFTGAPKTDVGQLHDLKPDDMLRFYWTHDRTVPTGWMKTVIDTRKDQIWTVPANMPAGATFKP